MSKVKPKRKSPSLDMTAMCDVAFLLLTFFMLTAKMRPTEPVPVDTPGSISETKLPDAGTLTILVAPDGKTYMDMVGSHTRLDLIADVNEQFKLGLNEEDAKRFAIAGSIGVPMENLRTWLRADPAKRAEMKVPGIPVDSTNNQLGEWVDRARRAQFRMKQEGKVKDEYVIIVKADKETPYPSVQKVINTLKDRKVYKFNLITNMEQDPNKPKKE